MHLLQSFLAIVFLVASVIASKDDNSTNTRNDLLDGECAPLVYLFARGTDEKGNIGNNVGPAFLNSLDDVFPADYIIAQGVQPYPATVAGYLVGGSPEGSEAMAHLIETADTQCPDSEMILSCWSQGCQVLHNAVNLTNPDIYPKFAALVLFGDPDLNTTFPVGVPESIVKEYCHEMDPICHGIPKTDHAHDTYPEDADNAAQFVLDVYNQTSA
ncbi:cutinase [Pyronema omphalodes]|nr:cutinase [Pyronema omphalodes]